MPRASSIQPNNATRYWGSFHVAGREISLSHLEPHEFLCATPDDQSRKVRVIYSDHVFTRAAESTDPTSDIQFKDRVFCPARYQDTAQLPEIVKNLPGTKVYQTWEKRNYVYLAVETPVRTDCYHIFFALKKQGAKKNKHVELRIESAYRNTNSSYISSRKLNKVRFEVLINNTYMGRPINFAKR